MKRYDTLRFLILSCILSLGLTRPGWALVISELMYHPVLTDGGQDEEQALEFIEIYNDRAVFEDLGGWAFTDGVSFTFPAETILPAGGYLVLARDPNAVEAAYDLEGVLGPYEGRLDNAGERLTLSDAAGQIVLSFRYDDDWPWPVSADGTGHSLILAHPGGDPEEASTWAPSTFIGGTPGGPDPSQAEPEDPTLVTLIDIGSPGRYFKGTQEPSPGPGGEPTTAWTQIAFDDTTAGWLSGPNGYGYSNQAEETQYILTTLSDMNGNYISAYVRLRFELTEEQIATFSQMSAEVHYDDDYVLYLNGTRVGASGAVVHDPPAYNWGRGSGWDGPAGALDLTGSLGGLVVGTNVLAVQFHNSNLSGSSDAFVAPILRAVVEPESSGADDPRMRLCINEILTKNTVQPSLDWLELYNPGPVPVDLNHVYLSNDRLDLLQYRLASGPVLQPGQFHLVPRSIGESEGFPFGLPLAGGEVFATLGGNDDPPRPIRVLDAVRFGPVEPGMTLGRYPDGADNFVALSLPTLGTRNAGPLRRSIVINEIMYHHGFRDERYEYVELYNRGEMPVDLGGWAFTDGIDYTFESGTMIPPDGYMVVAKDPNLLVTVYDNLVIGQNLVGPYSGNLSNHSERLRLSYPFEEIDPEGGASTIHYIPVSEVTYYDGGRWPVWADGQGASLELRDPDSDIDTPDAWAASDESGKTQWGEFSFTVDGADTRYTHDLINVFQILLLNRGEVLLDGLQLIVNDSQRLANGGFESGAASWRFQGNHVRSFVTTADQRFGSRALHLIASGHGDPGANCVNQSITGVTAGTVTFRGWAKWLRGSPYLLLRTARERAPVQPPRPAHAFELTMPANLGTPGRRNTAYTENRPPAIRDVRHDPVLPRAGEPIVVTACLTDNDGVASATCYYRSEGQASFTALPMVDDGSGDDAIAGDHVYTATIPGAAAGTMRAFYIEASDGAVAGRFPTPLEPSAEVPNRTCLVRVGDAQLPTRFARYRVWLSNDVINTFTSRPNLSNELLDCTFVYNDKDVFYNARIRFRGSPFIRSGCCRDPRDRYAYRIDFNPDQRFQGREEINLDNTEGGNRGPLQERASYWFYKEMGLQHSRQEYVRLIINGQSHFIYEDVQKIDGDYVDAWFPEDTDGYIHKIDDYFEYTADGTGFANLDEGLKYDGTHPLLKETYRWGFEKRSHREDDNWEHLFDFAVAMNMPSSDPGYEQAVESVIDPQHFARVLAIRHAVGDWDSYGYTRGKNNYFYYALPESRWYLLPWDIDFTLGSGHGPTTNIFQVDGGKFPEVAQFLNYGKYRRMYLQAFAELVDGPWKTSYGTAEPPTAFDRFLDDAAAALIADGLGDGRRDGIKQFVRDRRNYILSQIPSLVFAITTNNGDDFCTAGETTVLQGVAPLTIAGIAVNGTPTEAEFSGNNAFRVEVPLAMGPNVITLQGLNGLNEPVPDAVDTITVTRVPPTLIEGVVPGVACNDRTADLTILGGGFMPGSATTVTLTNASEEIGFDALYVQYTQSFDSIHAATLLLDDPERGVGDPVRAVHPVINLYQTGSEGIFVPSDQFAPPYNTGDPSNFAVRFTGYVYAPSPGVRYFGVNSDDGFALWIDGQLVGEYALPRGPATTDVNQNRTAGTMTFDFPAAGTYFLQLDFYENGGGEEVELFQTDSNGGNPRLINVDAELIVYRDAVVRIDAHEVEVVDEHTLTCQVDLAGAEADAWDVIVTPECGQAAAGRLDDGLRIVTPPVGAVAWDVTPSDPVVSVGREGGDWTPTEHVFVVTNTGSNALAWSVSKGAAVDWIDWPTPAGGTLAPQDSAPVTVGINAAAAAALPPGEYEAPMVFSIGCGGTAPAAMVRTVRLVVHYAVDFNLDHRVDWLDAAMLAEAWLAECGPADPCAAVDLDDSGTIGVGDLLILGQQWLVTGP